MIDEEITVVEPEEYIPAPEPAPEPDPAPAPEPESAPDPSPEPEAPAAPVEVITVEDLLDRITGDAGQDGEAEEPPQETWGDAPAEPGEDLPSAVVSEGPIEVAGMDTALKRLETIQGAVDHPMMETPFEDYTVTEGLLLLLLLSVFLAACVKMLKGGFAWLR